MTGRGWAMWLVAVASMTTGCRAEPEVLTLRSFTEGAFELSAGTERAPADAPPPPLAVKVPPQRAEIAAPDGYLRVTPMAHASEDGHILLLVESTSHRMVPVFINGTEGFSIQLRMSGKAFNRPLTHDLLDDVIDKLGAELVRAQVDRLDDGVYHGSVVLKQGDEVIAFDARPSDAIALALGSEVPIFVSQSVLEQAGHSLEDIERGRTPKAKHANPVSL